MTVGKVRSEGTLPVPLGQSTGSAQRSRTGNVHIIAAWMIPLRCRGRELSVCFAGLNRMDATPARPRRVAVAALSVAALVIVASPVSATSRRAANPRLVCPPHPPASLPHHQRAGVRTTMVPGHPRRLLGCRYHGLNQPQPQGTVAAAKMLPTSEVASEFDDARVISPGGPVPSCPADFGEQIMLVFGYADGSFRVTVDAGGCGYATNGARTVLTPPLLAGQLRLALGHDTL